MVSTLTQLLASTLKSYPKDDLLLVKKGGAYVPISTREFGDAVRDLCLGLNSLGFRAGDKLCLLSENRPEWVMTDFATLSAGGLTVPIYTTLVPEQVRYIIDDSDATVVVVSNAGLWKKVEPLRARLGKVRHFIMIDGPAPAGVLSFEELRGKGKARGTEMPNLFDELVARVKPGDEATLIYTSGTTGVPKGVILTHDNLTSNIRTASDIIEFTQKDTVLSFLPLSHILERMVMFTYLYKGCTVAFAESVEAVAQNLLEVRPHIMVSVPRVFEKIYTKVMDQVLVSPVIRRKIFFWALKVGRDVRRPEARREADPVRARAQAVHRPQAGVLQDHRQDGRPGPLLRLRRGPAVEGHRRVLLRHRPGHPRRLWPDRDLPASRHQHVRAHPVGDRR